LVTAAVCLLLLAAALAFRLPDLGNRPMHADEAVQAARFRWLWLQGRYNYDPNEYHGPTLNYATLPAVWAAGADGFPATTAAMYRIVPALFGAALVLLFCRLTDAVGRPAAWCAALLAAISPATVFYSRYYIHETLFVFFSLAAVVSLWRYLRSGKLVWCLMTGACVGLMQATKETSILSFAAAAGAALLVWIGSRWSASRRPAESSHAAAFRQTDERPAVRAWHLAAGAAVALTVAVTLYSSFFTHWQGPVDGLLTYVHWVGRAGGHSPHSQPWYYFLQILAWSPSGEGCWWSEGLILALALVGLVAANWPAGRLLPPQADLRFVRWTDWYTLLLIAAYSVIPYKTPWCLLNFHVGLVLLAGVGAVTLFRLAPNVLSGSILAVILLAAGGQLAWQSYQASFVHFAHPQNPYVHSPTQPKITELIDAVEELALAAPQGRAVEVRVIWHDHYYWPLPWYLRKFERVGYWNHVPDQAAAPIVISSAVLDEPLTAQLQQTHLMTNYYGIRHNVLAQLWVRDDLWLAHLRRTGRI
jgi:uncharacterized protein (TIGR03663 family)